MLSQPCIPAVNPNSGDTLFCLHIPASVLFYAFKEILRKIKKHTKNHCPAFLVFSGKGLVQKKLDFLCWSGKTWHIFNFGARMFSFPLEIHIAECVRPQSWGFSFCRRSSPSLPGRDSGHLHGVWVPPIQADWTHWVFDPLSWSSWHFVRLRGCCSSPTS